MRRQHARITREAGISGGTASGRFGWSQGRWPKCCGLVTRERKETLREGSMHPCTDPCSRAQALAGSRGGGGALMAAAAGRKLEVGRVRVSARRCFIGVEQVMVEQGTAVYVRRTSSTRQELSAGGRGREKRDFPFFEILEFSLI